MQVSSGSNVNAAAFQLMQTNQQLNEQANARAQQMKQKAEQVVSEVINGAIQRQQIAIKANDQALGGGINTFA